MKKTYFLGEKDKVGESVVQGNCPICGESSLDYGVLIPEGENISYPWTCTNCKSEGTEWYSITFEGHNVSHIHVVEPTHPTDADEPRQTIEIVLLAKFAEIGMDKPDNFDEMVDYIIRDVEETADTNFSDGDIMIGFRRFIQSI